MKRGDIYWAEIAPHSGSEQSGRRPVIIVSHDGFNETPGWRSIIVVPLSTSARQALRGPTVITIPEGGGLRKSSIALCHQVTTLDRGKLIERMGSLSSDLLAEVAGGLKAALDLE